MLSFVVEHLPRFIDGALITIQLALLSCAIGFAVALPVALARISRNWLLFGTATAYVFFFRGTPLLAQIFLIYYGSGQFRGILTDLGLWSYFREPWFCAVLSLTLNTGAYTSEILRGAIQALPKGEIEAGRALGLSRLLTLRLIVLPRAMQIAWPAYSNEVVYQIQATSLVSIITIMDITGVARAIGSRHFTFYEAFGVAAVLYLVLVYGFLLVSRRIERGLNRHLDIETPKLPGVSAGLIR